MSDHILSSGVDGTGPASAPARGLPAAIPTSALPVLYRSLEPVQAEKHAALRLRYAGFGFAREVSAIPLAAEEFAAAARSLPIVFAAQSPHLPVAVTGLAAGRNLLVQPDGSWRKGAYVPAYLRRYPFFLVRLAPNSEQLALCVDKDAPQLSATEGEPLFAADGVQSPGGQASGAQTPAMERALTFCRGVEEAAIRTRTMTEGLAELGLLKPAVLSFEAGGQPMRVDGFYAVDRPTLMALPPDKLAELRDRGWLEAIHAHLLSIGGIQDLARDAVLQPAA